MVFLSEPMSGLGFVSNYGTLMYQYLGISDNKSFQIQIGAQILSMSGATIAGEIPTSALRTKTVAIAISASAAVNTMWSFVAPDIFNPEAGNLKAKIGFVFGAFMVVFAIMAFFFVPETRLRSYEEPDELFMNKVPSRQFRQTITLAERRAGGLYDPDWGQG